MTQTATNTVVTIALPSTNGSHRLEKSIASFVSTCSNLAGIEIIIKIDPQDDAKDYMDVLKATGVKWKIIQYDKLGGYNDVHLFHYDMAKISTGQLIWTLGDDLSVVGDWYYYASLSRNIFKDNIYVCYFQEQRKINRAKFGASFPLISREMYKKMGYIGINRHIERFYRDLSYRIKRQIHCREVLVRNIRDRVHGLSKSDYQKQAQLPQPVGADEWAKKLYFGTHFTIMSNNDSFSFACKPLNHLENCNITMPSCFYLSSNN